MIIFVEKFWVLAVKVRGNAKKKYCTKCSSQSGSAYSPIQILGAFFGANFTMNDCYDRDDRLDRYDRYDHNEQSNSHTHNKKQDGCVLLFQQVSRARRTGIIVFAVQYPLCGVLT